MELIEPQNWQSAYFEYLYNFAKYKIDDKELIKDLIQDTFLAAIQRREKFKHECSEITWLTAILKYKIYRTYRNRKKKMLIYNDLHELNRTSANVLRSETGCPAVFLDPMDVKDFEREMKLFIATLPRQWQLVYNLKYLSDESACVICNKLKLSESNYWVITCRLRASLRQWYLAKWN